MGVIQPSPPELVEELARSSLLHLSRPASGKPSAALQRAERSAGVAEPVQVFYMGLRPMAGDASLAAAEAIAWRFFVLSGGRALAATEIALNRRGGPPYWSRLSYDPRIQTQLSVIRRVRSDARYEQATYELRFLRIPALDLSALLWLRAETDGQDLVIPMGSIAFLRPGWPYSVQKLFSAVEDHARRRLASSTAPPSRAEA